jgi:SAM-dependent methyltransferase
MRALLRSINSTLELFGLDLRKTLRSIRGLPRYLRARKTLKSQASGTPGLFPFGRSSLCLGEDVADSGLASGHYFHQDLLVARRVRQNQPTLHVDVGSRIDGFVAHVASFRDIEVFDIRPLAADIPNVRSVQVDLMNPLPGEFTGYCDSLSCLHALEHFGLGRYGDPVRYDGHLRGLENLHRILKAGGRLYLSVPIGPQRIEFNAHRVFSVEYLLRHLRDDFRVDRFSFVDDAGALHEDVPLAPADVVSDFGCDYGCGIFELTKL